MRRLSLPLVSLVITSLLCLATPLAAQSAVEEDGLYQAAKADLQAGRMALAVEKLKRGLRRGIEDDELLWTYRLAVAIAYDAMQKPIATLEAVEAFGRAIEEAATPAPATWQERLAGMRQRAKALEAEVLSTYGALVVKSVPWGARVYVDGLAQGEDEDLITPATLYLAPGVRQVRFELPDHEPVVERVKIVAGSRDVLDPTLVAVQAPAPIAPAATAEPAPAIEERGRSAWLDPLWGWITVGAGAALVATGVPFTVMALDDHSGLSKYEDMDPNDEEVRKAYNDLEGSMESNQTLAGVFYGVGAAVAIGGATWVAIASLSDDEGPAGDAAFGLVPAPGGGAMMTLGWRW
jgi:hypothetical protein